LADAEGADAEVAGLLTDYAGAERVATVALQLGDEFSKKKLYESALGLYEYVADNCTDSKQAMTAQRKIVTTHINLNDEDAAQQALDELALRFADDPRLSRELYEVGEYYRKRKNYPSARALYDYVATEFPQTNDAMWSAQRCIVMDIDLLDDPNNSQPQILAAIGEATDDFIAGYGEQKELVRALLYAGEIYYRRAFVKDPSGRSSEALFEFAKASAIFGKIIAQAPVHDKYTGEAHFMTAVGLSRGGQYDEAIPHHQAVVDNWPKHYLAPSSLYWIGNFQQKLAIQGLLTTAEADVRSEQVFLRLFEEYPDSTVIDNACRMLAAIHYRARRYEQALQYYELMVRDAPPNGKVPGEMYDLARTYERLEQPEMAMQAYQDYVADYPDVSKANRARARITALGGVAE